MLLDQAAYWRAQSQDSQADLAISRVLVLDPNNAEALSMQAQTAAEAGKTGAAAAALARLKAVRPDDPRIPGIEQALKSGAIDPAVIAQARAASKEHPDEAVAAYRRAFRSDAPPPAYAVEYYAALIRTKADWTIARAGLAALLRASPNNLSAQLAYAELLTYHPEVRQEGISRLVKLSQNPVIGAQATKDLRQSLLWLDVSPDSVPQYDIYLAKHPDDTEIAKLAQTARSNTGELKASAFYDMENGNLDDADAAFSDALRRVPNDVNAMIGLALTRWRQHRYAEGRALLKQAIALDPSKAADYQSYVDEPAASAAGTPFRQPGNVDYGRQARLRIQGQYDKVAALTKAGEFDQASALLRKLGGAHPSLAVQAYQADIQARGGHLAEAEAQYRAVLAKSPRNVQALGGLAGVLAREGKQAEADTLFAQAAALPGGDKVGAGRADALRLQAEQMSDPVAQIGMFRSAVSADPSNPWLRLALARALRGQGDEAGAREAMAPVGAAAHPTAAQMQAAIYFANETHDDTRTIALIDRLPPKERTAPLLTIRNDAQTHLDLRQAKALGSPAAERDRLLSLATQPDPSGSRVSAFGSELIRLGEKPAAREAVRVALAARPATAEQRVAYAGTLLGAGYPADARQITQAVVPANALMSQHLADVRDGAAVVTSDRLNAAGRPAAAYDQLAPRLAAAPDNPDLNQALARLYATNQQPGKAVRITQTLLDQNPSNLSVRSSAVYARLADGDLGQAASLAQESTVEFPDEPQAWLDLANVERARGHSGAALRALKTAKAMREKQLGGDQSSVADPAAVGGLAGLAPLRRYAQLARANTASDVSADAGPDPVSRQYARFDPAAAELPIEAPSAGAPSAALTPLAAAPVAATPRAAAPVAAVLVAAASPGVTPLAAAPVAAAPVGVTPLAAAPVAATPVAAASVAVTPLAAAPVAAAPVGAASPGVTALAAAPPAAAPFVAAPVAFVPLAEAPVAPASLAAAPSQPLVTSAYAPFTAPSAAPRIDTGLPVQTAQNSQVAQSVDGPVGGNPFGSGSSPVPTIDEPAPPSGIAVGAPTPGLSTDTITTQIDLGIQQVQADIAPRIEGSLSVRGRTGTPGFERLIELAAPIEASYSPNGYGRLRVVVTPTYLYSGQSSDSYDVQRYGTNPLGFGTTTGLGVVPPRNQTAFGTGLDVGYAYDIVSADIGATPLGFREQTIIGGIELAPKLTSTMTLRVLAERRAVTDSILSYAGLKDYRTGESWGGVTRNRGHVQLDGSYGLWTYFAGAGGGYLDGHNVEGNSEVDAGIGATYPVWRTRTQEVRVGTEVFYFGYDKNLGGFSLGQGGYFSPQDYVAVLFPVSYRDQYSPDLRFAVGGSVGFQTYRAKSSDVFPNNPGLQAQLVQQAATTGANTVVYGSHGAGVAGGVSGEIDYRVTPNLHIGGRAGFDHSGSYSEGTGLIYARYVFNDNL